MARSAPLSKLGGCRIATHKCEGFWHEAYQADESLVPYDTTCQLCEGLEGKCNAAFHIQRSAAAQVCIQLVGDRPELIRCKAHCLWPYSTNSSTSSASSFSGACTTTACNRSTSSLITSTQPTCIPRLSRENIWQTCKFFGRRKSRPTVF